MKRVLLFLSVVLGACGTPAVAPTPDAGSTDLVAPPMPPASPMPPQWTACPTGWRSAMLDDVAYCEPFAGDSAPTCAAAEILLPGVGCAPIDTCAADGWPADLPASGVIYVRAGSTGGDGTQAHPFATPQEGVAAAMPGDTVALAVGTYDGPVDVRGITLRGACTLQTIVRNPSSDPAEHAVFVGQHGVVRGLHIVAGNYALHVQQDATDAHGTELWLEAPYGALELQPQCHFDGDHMRIDGTTFAGADLEELWAVGVRPGSSVTLTHVSGTTAAKYWATGVLYPGEQALPMTLDLEDAALTGVPFGMVALTETTVRRSTFEHCTVPLASVGELLAEDVVIRDSVGAGGDMLSTGMVAVDGHVTAHRVYGARLDGPLFASQRTTSATLLEASDVVVSTTSGITLLDVIGGGAATITRLYAVGITSNAFVAESGASTISVTDARVTTLPRSNDVGDLADAHGASQITLTRVDATVGRVVALATSGSSITLDDLTTHGGIGPVAQCLSADLATCAAGTPASITIHRAEIHDVGRTGFGLYASRGELHDVVIDGVTFARDGSDAIAIQSGTLIAERVVVRNATSRAVLLYGDGSTSTITDLRVENVLGLGCSGSSCTNGDGITCALGAGGTIDRVYVTGASRGGLALVDDCLHLDIAHARVTGNEIGVLTDTNGAHGVTLESADVSGNVTDFNTVEIEVTAPVLSL